ncbi:MAG: hypothetical protein KA296_13710 [Marinobacter sp.]|nr:hypothetical protein [Marinobacter sp.]
MRNPNTRLPNRNTLYLGRSGSGKSTALKHNPAIPGRGAPVALWDPNEDHKARRYRRIGDFVKALIKADQVWRTQRRGYRIAYCGVNSQEAYNIWCKAVGEILDGRWLTYLIAEELADVSPHAGAAPPPAKKLLNQCRKYGGIFHGTSQKPTEISKTYYSGCDHRYIGVVKTLDEVKRMSAEIGLSRDEFNTLENIDEVQVQLWYDNSKTVEKWTHVF